MRHIVAGVTLTCLIAALYGGCASANPKYAAIADRLPAIKPGFARIYLYSVQPADLAHADAFGISIDGQQVGPWTGIVCNTCMFVDHPVGACKIGAWLGAHHSLLEPRKEITLQLNSGETRYVQAETEYSFPVQVRLVVADPDQAKSDLNKCAYIGTDLPPTTKE